MSKQVIQLNNEFTKVKNKEKFAPAPKRKHLGFILVIAILLFSLASMSLIRSYQNLQTQVGLEQKAIKQHEALTKEVATKSEEIKKLQDPNFLQKFARSQGYSKSDEKIFETQNPLIGASGVTP